MFVVKIVTEDWQDPGNKLHAAREAKGMSIADVAHRTRIPARILEALERDDYSSFPSPTYAKSFLSQYAEFVGVDPSEWLDYFEPASFTGPDDVLSILESPEAPEPRVMPAPRRSGGALTMLAFLMLSGALLFGAVKGYQYFEKLESSRHPAAHKDESKIDESHLAPIQPVEVATPRNLANPTMSASLQHPATDEPPAVAPPRARIVVEQ